VRTSLHRWLLVLAMALAALGLAAAASGDDRTNAEATLQTLEQDQAHKTLTADLVRRGRAALERATRMQASGDPTHARVAEGLALAWAEAARDLVRAADAEKLAATRRLDALDAGAHAERERALLEEGIARTGRLRAELETIQHGTKETPHTSAAFASGDAGLPVARPKRTGGPAGDVVDGGAP
jgi:hypothetical protein